MEGRSPLHLRIFISSPGDVAEERRLATQVLKQYQEKPHARGKITIEVVAWDDANAPTPMAASETPQESVNRFKGLPADCDLTIVVLWGRLGTHLSAGMVRTDGSRYESGTVWEYENAIQAGKPVWIYQRTETPRIDIDDLEAETKRKNYHALKDFVARFKNPDGSLKGGCNEYRVPSEFGILLDKQIETLVRNRLETEDTARRADAARAASAASSMCSAETKHHQVTRRNTIPRGRTQFIGRECEQTRLREKVLHDCVVTVTGAPGIGKTRLVMEVARSLESRFYVIWVSLSQLQEPSVMPQLQEPVDIPLRIARVLEIKGQQGKDTLKLIAEFLQQQERPLLILDNCEGVRFECAKVVNRLQDLCQELHVMLTSRIAMGIDAEHVYRVPPLKLPDPKHLPDLEALARIDSVKLLLERLEACASSTRLTEQNASKIAELCCDLSGLPLAVVLIAARMNILDLDAVLKQRAGWFNFSRGASEKADQNVKTLGNIIRWSYSQLGDEPNGERLKNLFRHLSVFKRGWTIEAAHRVCGELSETERDIEQLMDPLERASLIEAEQVAGRNRFYYLDIIREFANEELKKEGMEKVMVARHARWATEFAEHWQPRLLTKEQDVALLNLFAEVGNLREAFRWARQCQDAEIALRLTSALWRLMEFKGFYSEGAAYLRKALELPGTEKFPLLCAKALGGLSIMCYRQGDLDASERCSEQRLELEQEHGTDPSEEADALSDLGLVAMRRGKYEKALERYTQSLKIHQAKENKRYVAVCLFNMGALLTSMGKLDEAETNVKASHEMFEQAGNRRDDSFALNTLALIERYRGQYEAAGCYAERSFKIRKDLGDQGGMAQSMVTRADILIAKRHFDAALKLLMESGSIFLEINNERGIVEALEQLAALATDQGFYPKAVILYAAADELRKKLGEPLPRVAERDRDARIEYLRNALGSPGFVVHWEAGRVTPPREVFAFEVNERATPEGSAMSKRTTVLRMMKGQVALVGYGSLLSRSSLEHTLGRSYAGPHLQCSVRGWRRTWDAAMPNGKFYAEGVEGRITPRSILYLNVQRDPSTTINGVVFVVDQAELAAYDKRESIYERVEVREDVDLKVEGGPIYMYVCRSESCMAHSNCPKDAAVRATYLQMIEQGLSEFDEEFRQRYKQSTDWPPAHLIIEDRFES